MKSDFLIAVTQLAAERGLPREKVLAAVEAALASAYKKEGFAAGYDITVRLNPNTGAVEAFLLKTVVEEATDDRREMTLKEARAIRREAAIGDVIEMEAPFPATGRIAAQAAKQVVLQRLREAERELVLAEYGSRMGEIIPGRVERLEPQHVVVNLGKTEAILPREEQVPMERLRPGTTMQFYLLDVADTVRGPEIILSRSHRNLVRRLFEREVPEIFKGIVEIRSMAREPGSRTKVAVAARQEGVDPVGSCVGLRGFRIQNIVNELQGEKIDVVQWSESPAAFLASALSPAQVLRVSLNEGEKVATIVVPDRQLSLAIGREGQNARLTARLTGWKIEIRSQTEYEERLASAAQAMEAAAEAVALVEAPVAVAEAPAAPVAAEAEPVAATQELQPAPHAVTPPVAEPTPVEGLVRVADLLELEEEAAAEEEEEEDEEEGLSPDDESIWVVPTTIREPSVLRFAEDIMPERSRVSRDDRGRRGRGDVPAAKPKRGKRPPRSSPSPSSSPGSGPGPRSGPGSGPRSGPGPRGPRGA